MLRLSYNHLAWHAGVRVYVCVRTRAYVCVCTHVYVCDVCRLVRVYEHNF